VILFAVWGQVFGRAQLGRIQGTAQMRSVFAMNRMWTGKWPSPAGEQSARFSKALALPRSPFWIRPPKHGTDAG
jgi:hypothetical protein